MGTLLTRALLTCAVALCVSSQAKAGPLVSSEIAAGPLPVVTLDPAALALEAGAGGVVPASPEPGFVGASVLGSDPLPPGLASVDLQPPALAEPRPGPVLSLRDAELHGTILHAERMVRAARWSFVADSIYVDPFGMAAVVLLPVIMIGRRVHRAARLTPDRAERLGRSDRFGPSWAVSAPM